MDQYGNPSLTDYLALSKGISAMNASQEAGEYTDARDSLLDQHGSVHNVMQNVDPNTLDQYQLKAYRGFADNYNGAMTAKKSRDEEVAGKRYFNQLKANGWNFDAIADPTTRSEHSALAKIRERWTRTEQGKKTQEAMLDEIALRQINDATPYLHRAEEFMRKGDHAAMRKYLSEASKIIGSGAYYYEDDGTGYLVKKFRANRSGDYEDIAHLTEEEVFAEMKEMLKGNLLGEGGQINPQLSRLAKMSIRATGQGNTQSASNPQKDIIFKDKHGKEYRGVLQNSPIATGPSKVFLYGPDGSRVYNQSSDYTTRDRHSAMSLIKGDGNFTLKELNEHGFVREDLGREKDLATIKKTNQQIETSRLAGESHKVSIKVAQDKADRDAKNALLKQYRDAFSDTAKMLKGVKDGEGNVFNFLDIESMDAMAPADRKPFMQKVVEISQDPALSEKTRSTARRYLALGEKLGYISGPPSEEESALKEAYKRLIDGEKPPEEAKALLLKAHPDKRELLTGRKTTAMRPH